MVILLPAAGVPAGFSMRTTAVRLPRCASGSKGVNGKSTRDLSRLQRYDFLIEVCTGVDAGMGLVLDGRMRHDRHLRLGDRADADEVIARFQVRNPPIERDRRRFRSSIGAWRRLVPGSSKTPGRKHFERGACRRCPRRDRNGCSNRPFPRRESPASCCSRRAG